MKLSREFSVLIRCYKLLIVLYLLFLNLITGVSHKLKSNLVAMNKLLDLLTKRKANSHRVILSTVMSYCFIIAKYEAI